MAQPSFISEELISPTAMQGVSVIANNLNEAAQRAVQLSIATQQMKLQEKLANAEMASKAKQYKEYQDFQAEQAEKQRAFDEAQNKEARTAQTDMEAMRQKHQDELLSRQEELRAAELEKTMKVLETGSDRRKQARSERDTLRKDLNSNEDAIAALELQSQALAGNQEAVGELIRTGAEEAGRMMATQGQVGFDLADEAVNTTLEEAVKSQKSGLLNYLGDAADGPVSKAFDKNVSMEPFKSGPLSGGRLAASAVDVLGKMASDLGTSLQNWMGLATPVEKSTLTSSALLIGQFTDQLAPKLEGATGKSAIDIKAALNKTLAAGVMAAESYKEGGMFPTSKREDYIKDFQNEAAALGNLIGPHALQGVMKALSGFDDRADSMESLKPYLKDVSESERTAIKSNFSRMGDIADVFQAAAKADGSPLKAMAYDADPARVTRKLLEATANLSISADDFAATARQYGISEEDIHRLAEQYKSLGTTTMKQFQKRASELKSRSRTIQEDIDSVWEKAEEDAQRESSAFNSIVIGALKRGN